MKSSTKIRIGVCILFCILFLALIGHKTREKFGVEESSNIMFNQSGHKILYDQNPNKIIPIDAESVPESCVLSTKTNSERESEIERDAEEAKKQLEDHLKKLKEAEAEKNERMKIQDNKDRVCTFLKFPALL